MRLIDADALIEALNSSRWQDQSWVAKHHWSHVVQLKDLLIKLIEESPTINPEGLRPKGKWKTKTVLIKSPFALNHYCSLCHGDGDCRYNFCPNCGAKMEE